MKFIVVQRLSLYVVAMLLMVFLGITAHSPRVWAVGGALLWQDLVDKGGDTDRAFIIDAAAGRVFAAGVGTNSGGGCNPDQLSGNCDYLVRAYDATTGGLLWENQFDRAGGYDQVRGLVVSGRQVLTSGVATNAAGNGDFLIRVYNSMTGSLVWENQVDKAGGFDIAFDIIAASGRVFAGGVGQNAAGNFDFLVRAHNAGTGAFLWEDQLDEAGGFDRVFALATAGTRVFATGSVTNAAGNEDFIVRAYDAATGVLSWEDQFDKAGGRDVALDVVVAGGQVFAVGLETNAAGNLDFLVRTYDATTGALLWQDQVDKLGGRDEGIAIASSGGRVFAGGGAGALNQDFLVRAYDAATGAFLWEDQFDVGGGLDAVFSLGVAGGRVFAAGHGTNFAGNFDFLVRAYDASTGAIVWTNQFDQAGGNDAAFRLVAQGGRVFAAGFATNSAGNQDFLVRAFDAQ